MHRQCDRVIQLDRCTEEVGSSSPSPQTSHILEMCFRKKTKTSGGRARLKALCCSLFCILRKKRKVEVYQLAFCWGPVHVSWQLRVDVEGHWNPSLFRGTTATTLRNIYSRSCLPAHTSVPPRTNSHFLTL